ncbi:MAG: NUDIX domain-containing protein [Thermomicrobiales bacterium]
MRVLRQEQLIDGALVIEHRIVASEEPPPAEQVTAAFALAFSGDCLLLADLVRRGLDLPGGHVEPGESPEEAMRREVYEETGARLGPARCIAYEHYHLVGEKPPDHPFPYPDSYMVFFCAQVVSLDVIASNEETQGRTFLAPNEARTAGWVIRYPDLYELGLAAMAATT